MRETKKCRKMIGDQRGITLIALVITIIVLLLLAGVAISMLSGENGVINKANSAKTENEDASIEEQVKIAAMAALIEGYGKIDGDAALGTLNEELGKIGFDRGTAGDDGKYPNDITNLPADITVGGIDFNIDANGNVSESIGGDGVENEGGEGSGDEEVVIPPDDPVTPLPQIADLIGSTVSEKTNAEDASGDKIVIPAGFKLLNEATLVKDGIVVEAPDGSEFVWVPVENINSMVMCKGSTGKNNCNIEKLENKLVCKTHSGYDICGKLYTVITGDFFNEEETKQKYYYDSDETETMREPDVLTSTDSGDHVIKDDSKGVNLLNSIVGIQGDTNSNEGQTAIKNTWQTQLQEEYEIMAISVYENHGFYVGRYEISLDENYKAQSKPNNTPIHTSTVLNKKPLTWYGLYQIEKEYNQKEVKGKTLENIVGSTMIWGSQYDQMMLWMQENEYNVKSNKSAYLKNATRNTSDEAGNKSFNDKLNNVYDLLGCNQELTLEACHNNHRVMRGGSRIYSYSPSIRMLMGPNDNTYEYNSSRITLYLK